jgi:hypothetical protein
LKNISPLTTDDEDACTFVSGYHSHSS